MSTNIMSTNIMSTSLSADMSTGMSAAVNTKAVARIVPMIDLNPLRWLGDKAKETLADGFTSMMMAIWSGAMWLLKTAFSLIDSFTPSVDDPDLVKLYSVTLWIALVIALVVGFGQIGLAVLRQDGRGFGNLAAGIVQYGVVLSCWVGVSAGLITAAAGLTKSILNTLLGVDSFSGYAAGDGFVDTVSGTTQAAVLGICGLFILIPATFGHMVIMMVRSAALLILVATMPIAAAGALSEGTKSWMWKSIRWFLACVLMQPLLALVVGMGTQFAWAGMPDNTAGEGALASTTSNIGVSVVGSIIMLVACFMPLVLFRMLAFVDPGTASGASFRSTMDANGNLAGLLHGRSAAGKAAGSGAAGETATDGRTTSENGAEAQTANRFQSSGVKRLGGPLSGGAGGRVGGAISGAMEKTGRVAQLGAAMSVDVLGQSGIGNQGYYPVEHTPKQRRHGQQGQHGHEGQQLRPFNDTNGDGVANDIPPEAIEAAELA